MSTSTDDRAAHGEATPVLSRRRWARREITSALLYVDFGSDNGGIVLNLSEGGFSVQAVMPLAPDGFSNMRFKGGLKGGSVEVGGRLVWISENRKAAGIQFVALSGEARTRIAEWIASDGRASQEDRLPANGPSRQSNSASATADRVFPSERVQGPAQENDRVPFPIPEESPVDRGSRQRAKLLHLVPVGSDSPFSPRSNERENPGDGNGASHSTDAVPDAPDGFEEILRNQFPASESSTAPHRYWAKHKSARLPNFAAMLPRRGAAISRVVLVIMLTLAGGFAFAYGVLRRISSGPLSLTAKGWQLSIGRDAPLLSAVNARSAAPGGAGLQAIPPSSSTTTTPEPSAPPSAAPRTTSPEDSSGTAFQSSLASPQTGQNPPGFTDGKMGGLHSGASGISPSGNVRSVGASYSERHAMAAKPPVDASRSFLSESAAPIQTQTVQISIQTARTDHSSPHSPALPANALAAPFVSGSIAGVDAATPPGAPVSAVSSGGADRSPDQPHSVLASVPVGHMDPCRLIHPVQPVYPEEARLQHLEGNVELRVVVGTDGTVQSVRVVSGLPQLASAAMDAARAFRYTPALLNGKPIQAIQTIDMSFKLP